MWVSSDDNIRNLQTEPRQPGEDRRSARPVRRDQVKQIIAKTKPNYHLMGGLHSGETGPSEMLMELAYRLATETSPLVRQIRDNVIVSITPVADPDGRDRNLDWFYQGLAQQQANGDERQQPAAAARRTRGTRRTRHAGRCRTGASTSTTTTTATSTCRRCRCARSSTGTSPRIRRSCTTCTRRSRCSTPTAAVRRRTPTSIRSCSRSCRSSRTSRWSR